jgi:hypothetical protein
MQRYLKPMVGTDGTLGMRTRSEVEVLGEEVKNLPNNLIFSINNPQEDSVLFKHSAKLMRRRNKDIF